MATNPMQRKARISFILGVFVTLLICGIIIALLFMEIKKFKDKEAAEKQELIQVYALNTDVKTGNVITSDMYDKITVKKSMVPANASSKDTLDIYSLQDKEGNEIHTKENQKNEDGSPKYYITRNEKEYEVIANKENNNFYITDGETKTIIELNSIPVIAKVTMYKNTILTKELLNKGMDITADDVRRQEYNMFALPSDLETDDYVDLRLMLPNGQDYIVISKKRVEIPEIGGETSPTTVWLNVSEDELLTISSAIVDAYRVDGSKLYMTKYTEAGIQKAATPTYVASYDTITLINNDPNILAKASNELKNRYNNLNYRQIRDEHIDKIIKEEQDSGESNVKSKMNESINATLDLRKKYLDSLNGGTTE